MRKVTKSADHLSEGVLVEGQVRARLLGMPILRLDAEVVLAPARPEALPPVLVEAAAPVRSAASTASARRGPSEQQAALPPAADDEPGPIGSELARAVALVQQGDVILRLGGDGRH
jgi:hypothetical protein